MHIGLYFGSFNPIHTGHLIIANTIKNQTDIDKVWFVVSPQNPLKNSSLLLDENIRLELVQKAIEDNTAFEVCTVEFLLPRPSYTIDTLTYLRKRYTNYTFSIIMGSDSFASIHHWKKYETLLNENHIMVYKRPGDVVNTTLANIHIVEGPLLEISSTYIRNIIKEGKSAKYLLPDSVWEIIKNKGFYR